MSHSKRRKLELGNAPPSPVSAISAIAARRRLTEPGDASSPDTPSTPETKTGGRISSPNAFSALQNLSRQGNSASDSAARDASAPKTTNASRPGGLRRTDTPRNTPTLSTASSLSEIVTSPIIQFTSFRPSKRNYRVTSQGIVQLSLDEGERFLVIGSFGVRILEGEVTVAGATLRPSHDLQWIHAPQCYAAPVLRTTLDTKLELHTDPTATSLRELSRLSPLLRGLWGESGDSAGNAADSTFRIIYSSDDVPDRYLVQELVSPPAWNRKLAELVTSATDRTALHVLICGPKSAGKSTFGRLLTNRLVTRQANAPTEVACLDLDPGQPEYGLPGTLSLVRITKANLSPSFTRSGFEDTSNSIVRCHATASVSPASDPDLYRACAVDLYETYCRELAALPLIINTPGWILGTGLELLGEIIELTATHEVVYMSEEGPAETVDALRGSTKNIFSTLPSQQSEASSRTAAHFRAMQTMCYFHQDSTNLRARPTWYTSPLTTVAPLQVRYSGVGSGISGILTYHYQSPSELLAEIINGTALAAVEIEDPRAFRRLLDYGSTSPAVSKTPEGLPYISNPYYITLDPRYCRTIGLVLVRGIDPQTQTLQILTPIPLGQIEAIKTAGRDIVLVHGKFDVPGWAYTEDLYLRGGDDDSQEPTLEGEEDEIGGEDIGVVTESSSKAHQGTASPWVEVLKGNQKRPTGSKVWRVRRDLGRKGGDG